MDAGDIDFTRPSAFFMSLGKCIRTSMGGSSGVLLDILCASAHATINASPCVCHGRWHRLSHSSCVLNCCEFVC